MPQVFKQKNSGDSENLTSTKIAQADEEDGNNVTIEEEATRPPASAINSQSLGPEEDDSEESFIQSLCQSTSSGESESHRFTKLERWFENNRTEDRNVVVGSRCVIKKVTKRTHYIRMANVSLKNMHNKFILPVWASAFNENKHVGYLLYPKLTPVREMLYDVKNRDRRSEEKEEDMNCAIRMAIAPLALAVDALHTPVLNRRTQFYHRDICLDNVFVSRITDEGSDDRDMFVYGEAMLKMTRVTRECREMDAIDMRLTLELYQANEKYFHHPEPYKDFRSSLYYKRHDWFSVGVYILEVLGIALHKEEEFDCLKVMNTSPTKIADYLQFATLLRESIEERTKEDNFAKQTTAEAFVKYIEIAEKYIKNDQLSGEQIRTHSYGEKEYYFEYGLHENTADLLCLFDEIRGNHLEASYKSMQDIIVETKKRNSRRKPKAGKEAAPEYVDVCQACLQRAPVPLTMKAYRRGASRRKCPDNPKVKNKCDDSCSKFYCAQCYMNGERLFCPMQHGTASTVIGHYRSFALLLYGEEFQQRGKESLFERDATGLSNVLKHKMIVGLHEDNVRVKPVFCKDRKKSAKQCLQDVCTEMRELIHGRPLLDVQQEGKEQCTNDTDYCLFVLYSGHGKGEHDPDELDGSWSTTGKLNDNDEAVNVDSISAADIKSQIDSIIECGNCSGSCGEITFMMAHCFPRSNKDMLDSAAKGGYKDPKLVILAPEFGFEECIRTSDDQSDIIHWFCTLLRSLFAHDCRTKSKNQDPCDTCKKMKGHIAENCSNAFIDGLCLKYHKRHMEDHSDYNTEMRLYTKGKVVLGRYHPDGIHYRLFPYNEEHGPVDLDFTTVTEFSTILTEVKKDHKQAKRICLLANNDAEDTKYGLVWAGDLRDKLESTSATSMSQLVYHIIKDPVKVILCVQKGEERAEDEFEIDVDKADICTLCNEYVDKEKRVENMAPTQLPNILVLIVHHLFHYTGYIDNANMRPVSADLQNQRAGSAGESMRVSKTGFSSQVNGSSLPKQERIRNSFAGRVYRDCRETQLGLLTEDKWRTLEKDAGQYLQGDRERPFKVDLDLKSMRVLSIKWSDPDVFMEN